MINLAYRIESIVAKLRNHKLSVGVWYILRFLVNILLPLYYKLIPIKTGKLVSEYINDEVILSLTTFPPRLVKLPIVLETLYRQTVRPTRIVLWLADIQFKDKELVNKTLGKYIELGLEIRYCEDLRAHKKYFYTMKENPDSVVITVDDDVLYPNYMVERLITTYKDNKDCIVCTRAHKMMVKNGVILPYSEWNMRALGCIGPDLYLCPTGCGGCLYPPRCLSKHVFEVEIIKKICFYADDIWLKCMEYIAGTKVILTGKDNPEIIDIIGGKNTGLAKINIEQNLNDKQLNAVTSYYDIKW